MTQLSYPSNLVRDWTSKDGTRMVIRPIRPADAQIEKDFVHHLSSRSKYFRFFSGMIDLTPAMLARLTCIDFDREMALIAVVDQDGREVEIAVGRYTALPDGKSCEFAIVVDDAWQHHGIGYQIMSDLIRIAKDRGFQIMKGLILSLNLEMIQLAKDLGFQLRQMPDDPKLIEASKDL